MRLGLVAKSIQRSALSLQSLHDVLRHHGFALCVLCINNGVSQHILQELLQYAARLVVCEAANALDATASRQTSDCWLRNTLDIVAQHLAWLTLHHFFAFFHFGLMQ